MISPFFDVLVNLLILSTDGAETTHTAPQNLGDVFHTTDRNTGQIHFDKSFFHRNSPPHISFNNGRSKRQIAKFGNLQLHFPRSCLQTLRIMFRPVTDTTSITLVTPCLAEIARSVSSKLFKVSCRLFRKISATCLLTSPR